MALKNVMIFTRYEIGTHCGKSIPTLTMLPPVSPLMRLAIGNFDDSNALFHHTHHTLNFYNFGITQWMDLLMGTAKYDPRCTTPAEQPDRRKGQVPQ